MKSDVLSVKLIQFFPMRKVICNFCEVNSGKEKCNYFILGKPMTEVCTYKSKWSGLKE